MTSMDAFYRRLTATTQAADSYQLRLRRLAQATLDEVQVFQSNLDWYEWGTTSS